MDYKSLLVHVDRGERRADRIELAFRIAESFGARVTGLFALSALPVPSQARRDIPEFLAGMIMAQHFEAQREAHEAFRLAMSRHPEVPAEWRHSEEDAIDAVLLSARYADLVIVGQHERDARVDSGLDGDFVGEILLRAGKPVLVVPYAGSFDAIGRRVLVAWNAAPEASRAVDYALPMLSRAEQVHVAVFSAGSPDGAHGEEPGADIALHIARHHGNVSVSTRRGGPGEIGSEILNHAADFGADLIVMGAYGHSRLRERVFGGATRTLLESMTAPVLMSH